MFKEEINKNSTTPSGLLDAHEAQRPVSPVCPLTKSKNIHQCKVQKNLKNIQNAEGKKEENRSCERGGGAAPNSPSAPAIRCSNMPIVTLEGGGDQGHWSAAHLQPCCSNIGGLLGLSKGFGEGSAPCYGRCGCKWH